MGTKFHRTIPFGHASVTDTNTGASCLRPHFDRHRQLAWPIESPFRWLQFAKFIALPCSLHRVHSQHMMGWSSPCRHSVPIRSHHDSDREGAICELMRVSRAVYNQPMRFIRTMTCARLLSKAQTTKTLAIADKSHVAI